MDLFVLSTEAFKMVFTGRGGAGNKISAPNPSNTSTPNADVPRDLEASQQTGGDYTAEVIEAKERQLFAHKGRGGAGNYYSPKELAVKGTFAGAETSHELGDGTPAPTGPESISGDGAGASDDGGLHVLARQKTRQGSMTKATYTGRGGAGNYSFGVTESEEKNARKRAEEEEVVKERLREDIEQDVADGLKRPEKAMLSGSELV